MLSNNSAMVVGTPGLDVAMFMALCLRGSFLPFIELIVWKILMDYANLHETLFVIERFNSVRCATITRTEFSCNVPQSDTCEWSACK
jgi:hypothetical protein